jgi:hypothetical protein
MTGNNNVSHRKSSENTMYPRHKNSSIIVQTFSKFILPHRKLHLAAFHFPFSPTPHTILWILLHNMLTISIGFQIQFQQHFEYDHTPNFRRILNRISCRILVGFWRGFFWIS